MGEPRRHPEWEDLSERDRLRLIFEKLEDLHEQGQETNDLLANVVNSGAGSLIVAVVP